MVQSECEHHLIKSSAPERGADWNMSHIKVKPSLHFSISTYEVILLLVCVFIATQLHPLPKLLLILSLIRASTITTSAAAVILWSLVHFATRNSAFSGAPAIKDCMSSWQSAQPAKVQTPPNLNHPPFRFIASWTRRRRRLRRIVAFLTKALNNCGTVCIS